MATHIFDSTLGYSGAPAPAILKPIGFRRAVEAIVAAFNDAAAAEHIYEGLIAHHVPRDEAAARTFQMLYGQRTVN